MTDQNAPNSDPASPDDTEKAKKAALVVTIIRGMGVFLMLMGAVFGLNIGGAADYLGLGALGKIIGGILLLMGCVDFFVMPQILGKALGPKDRV